MDSIGFYVFAVNNETANPDGSLTYEGSFIFRELTQEDINTASEKDLERFLKTINIQLSGGGDFSDSPIFKNRIKQSEIYLAKYFIEERLSNSMPSA